MVETPFVVLQFSFARHSTSWWRRARTFPWRTITLPTGFVCSGMLWDFTDYSVTSRRQRFKQQTPTTVLLFVYCFTVACSTGCFLFSFLYFFFFLLVERRLIAEANFGRQFCSGTFRSLLLTSRFTELTHSRLRIRRKRLQYSFCFSNNKNVARD